VNVLARVKSFTSPIGPVLAATAMMLAATDLSAESSSVADCYERVLAMCNEALENAKWWEKPAIGVLCTGMLAGCTAEALTR
jgi:hypothetical protein